MRRLRYTGNYTRQKVTADDSTKILRWIRNTPELLSFWLKLLPVADLELNDWIFACSCAQRLRRATSSDTLPGTRETVNMHIFHFNQCNSTVKCTFPDYISNIANFLTCGTCCGEPPEEESEPLIKDAIRDAAHLIHEFDNAVSNSGYKSIRLDDTECIVILYYLIIVFSGRINWTEEHIPDSTCMVLRDSFVGYIMEKSDDAASKLDCNNASAAPCSSSNLSF
jgi:predicted metal-binding protein